jgi:hypothetical protein
MLYLYISDCVSCHLWGDCVESMARVQARADGWILDWMWKVVFGWWIESNVMVGSEIESGFDGIWKGKGCGIRKYVWYGFGVQGMVRIDLNSLVPKSLCFCPCQSWIDPKNTLSDPFNHFSSPFRPQFHNFNAKLLSYCQSHVCYGLYWTCEKIIIVNFLFFIFYFFFHFNLPQPVCER